MRIFNRYNLITATIFILGFILVLLNEFSVYLNLSALAMFFVGFVLMAIALFKNAINKDSLKISEQEELVMELSVENGQEQYVLEKDKKPKKLKNFKENLKIYFPSIFCVLISILLLVVIVSSIIKLVK